MRQRDGELILFWTLPVVAIIWVSAFLLFPGFLHPMSPTMSAEEVAAFYRDDAARIRYSMILFNWFGVGLIPVVILLAMQIRRMAHRTPIVSYSLIACAGGPPTLFLIANMFWLLGAFRPERAPELTQLLNDLAWITFTILVPYLIAQCLLLALAIYWDRQDQPVFKPWVAHFNLLIAVALAPAAFTALASTGPLAWDGLLSFWVKNIAIFVWIIVMGIVLGQTIRTAASTGTGRRMSASTTEPLTMPDPPAGSRMSRLVWNFRHHPKRELWFAWWVMVIFYKLYGVLFFFVTRVQPPASPAWDTPTVVQWFRRSPPRHSRRVRRRIPHHRYVRADECPPRVFDAADVGESALRVLVLDHLFAQRHSRHAGDGDRDDRWSASAGP